MSAVQSVYREEQAVRRETATAGRLRTQAGQAETTQSNPTAQNSSAKPRA